MYVVVAVNIDIPHWCSRRSMEAAESSPPAEISRVAVRLPPFCAERPAVWFPQAEAQFFLAGVNSEKTKSFT
jgi:hypothetical protein